MTKRKDKILALDPGAREMGVAVLQGDELIFFGVKSLRKFRPANNLRKALNDILNKLVIQYSIDIIVVEKAWFSQEDSPLFQTAINTIIEFVKRKKLPLEMYAPNTIRSLLCKNGRANKQRVARVLADKYNELEIYLEQTRRWKELYWNHAFDALSVGLTHILKNQNN